MDNFIKKHKKQRSGFTLIELVVVIGIFVVVSTIVLFNYSGFKSNVSLENLSQDIALTVRKAQVFGVGVEGTQISGTRLFPGYGIHFNIPANHSPYASGTAAGDEKSFVFFADIPSGSPPVADQKYDESDTRCSASPLGIGNECLSVDTITTTDLITKVCAYSSGGTSTCSDNGATLDVVFTRPYPDAHFCLVAPSNTLCDNSVIYATVTITSQAGTTKTITIWNTGSISVQ